MLGKLMKYDILAVGRTLLPLYGAVLLVSALSRIFALTGLKTIETMSSVLVVFLFIAVIAVTVVLIIQRFYKNLMGDEGYLMFTLPVKVNSLVLSKLFTSILCSVTAVLCGLLALLIMFTQPMLDFFRAIPQALDALFSVSQSAFGLSPQAMTGIFILVALLMAAALVAGIMYFYTCIAIGQLFQKNRIAMAFVAYIVINFIWQLLMVGAMMLIGLNYNFNEVIPNPFLLLSGCIAYYVVQFVIYFITTRLILKKKLNLQ